MAAEFHTTAGVEAGDLAALIPHLRAFAAPAIYALPSPARGASLRQGESYA